LLEKEIYSTEENEDLHLQIALALSQETAKHESGSDVNELNKNCFESGKGVTREGPFLNQSK
jgi:hypothetical protein